MLRLLSTLSLLVVLHVGNGQDNHPPSFQTPYYFKQFAEHSIVGTTVLTVSATDIDVNDTLVYALVTGKADFNIDGSSGIITAKREFDREKVSSYVFTVSVSDGVTRPFTEQTSVHVLITDINDKPPVFVNTPYSVTLSENTNTGLTVLSVRATDADQGINSRVQYKIISGDKDGHFRISLYTGDITLEKSLDYESQASTLVLTVQASDLGSSPLTASLSVNIHITDFDDQGPKFAQSAYSKMIQENLNVGTSVLTVSAFDQDKGSGQNHRVSYSISSGNDGNAFSIDSSSGRLTVGRHIDRETHAAYNLIIEAEELGSSQAPVSVRTVVTILDTNDNPPVFQQTNYSASLRENAQVLSIVIQVVADDNDTDTTYKLLTYDFNPPTDKNRPFLIHPSTGVITLTSALDYESGISAYSFQVTATNVAAPKAFDTAYVVVNIIDINDNNPIFGKTVFAGNQDEETPANTFILRAIASDADSGVLGQLSYSIVAGNDNQRFVINSTTADIMNAVKLDREVQESYTLTVQAIDSGPNKRTARAAVNIVVNDINDNAPQFADNSVTVRIAENNQVGSQVAAFSATDSDAGNNGALTYKILAGNTGNAFEIADSSKGIVTARVGLDYETSQSYTLTIEVRDGGPNGGMADNGTLTVNVENRNDNTPVFSSSFYNYSVLENRMNTVVGSVSATDADGDAFSFGRVVYSLAGVYSSRFNIGSKTGQITTKVAVDREDAYGDVYNLLAIAEDEATEHRRRTTADVTIHVLDENDNYPTFSSTSYSASITEESLHPDFVTVTATDPDKGENGKVTYNLTAGDTDSLFSIDASTGRISATGKPDREGLGASYKLTVRASDDAKLPKTSTATVSVSITDVNDNNPVFDLLQYRSTISENDLIGNEVVRVRATEKDVGLSATITYNITAGVPSSSKFSIDTGTGSVTTKGTIDYESDAHIYNLTVTATDGLGRQGTCTVLIFITDYNDNAPVFTQSLYTKSIRENMPTTSFVTNVSATDGDTGSSINRQLVYSILGGAGNTFSIHSLTGDITVLSPPDYETKKMYTLDIQAKDQANPASSRLAGVSKVEITITDENDNTPTFDGSYAFSVVESATVGELVGAVSASDLDDPNVNDNGVVTYSLTGSDDFVIGNKTGHISVAKLLDYEVKSSYDLTVTATDGGGKSSSTPVKITVIDVNDNPPKFAQSSYTATINENVPLDHSVVQVSASEKDTGKVIAYSLSGGDGRFHIVSTTGQILTANSIDYETAKKYTFQVTASDDGNPPRNSFVPVTVTVKDLNDNDPLFAQTRYTATLKEELPGGQGVVKVSASDKDSSTNADVSYAIIDGVGKFRFTIDSRTGSISTTTSLDRETQDLYSLTLQTKDGGSPPRATNATLIVTVEDINDNSPYFDPSTYSKVMLVENTAIGTSFLTVTAKDADIGVNQKIAYSLNGGEGRFQVNQTSGELTTLSSLNRETTIDYTLTVTARDSGLVQKSATVDIAVTVTDVNDNAPAFTKSVYSGAVVEGSPNGTVVSKVSATDSDDGDNGVVVYSIIGGNGGGEFRVSSNGQILTTSVDLDRETKPSYTLTVEASDKGTPPKSITVPLQVTVTDANDNKPVFSASKYASTVSELSLIGTTVLSVTATDVDLGNNAAIVYSFADPRSVNVTSFSIDASSGSIKTTKTLNAEVIKEYTFDVRVTDKGLVPRSSDATVVVTVRDVNDNDPVFNQTIYRANVFENNAAGTSVTTVLATESDTGDNAKISYSITFGDSSKKFLINAISGAITTTGTLDRETVSLYTLTVTATDSGSPPRSGQSTVEVKVLDTNDQSPKFEFSLYTKTVPEGTAAIGTVVTTVSASDADLGQNSKVSYSITSGNSDGVFSIANAAVGNITTVKAMDREATPDSPAYTLTITATDGGTSGLTGTTEVQVTVSDINDNTPQFVNAPYSAAIAENLSGGSSVAHVSATDDDAGTNSAIVYKLEKATPSSGMTQFELDSDSGLLRTKPVSLDYEMIKSYTFEVSASDKGSPSKTVTTTVSVTIKDVNDNDPIFIGLPYKKTLAEGPSSDGTTIVTISASDEDSGSLGLVRYSITSGNAAGHFAIDSSRGVIMTTEALDYESTRAYTLTVTAQDQNGTVGSNVITRSATTSVSITVTDVNDNAPVFNLSSYSAVVSESSLIGVEVVTLTASDRDSSSNSQLVYSIMSGNTNSDFAVDSIKGKVTVAKSLDIERTDRYVLEMSVRDKGTPPMNSTTTVQIEVADVNDNAPVFGRNQYSVDLNEGPYVGTAANTAVTTVSATDADLGANGDVSYNITSGDKEKLFTIDTMSGKITVTGTLDRETTSSYDLTIEAADRGLVKLTGTTHVLIRLLDINDNTPQFVETSYRGTINENAESNKIVDLPIRIKAIDNDIGNNKVVRFSLSGTSSGNFSINSSTAVVTTSDDVSLDRETVDSYSLTVTATDLGGLSSSVPFTVTVTDENDNNPFFDPNVYKPNILENATVGFVVTTVTASDADVGANGQIHYGVLSGSGGKFRVDPTTGVVTVDDVLSRELQEQYVMNVSATDGGSARRLGFATVTVTLVDINDNTPVFERQGYTVDVLENATIGSSVVTVKATDVDDGVNGDLSYEIVSGDASKFAVHRDTGEVTIVSLVDRESISIYILTIRCSDDGAPKRWATTTVKIVVLDVNDNPPIFSRQVYTTSLVETVANGSIILVVAASDADLGRNRMIEYSLPSNTSLFSIDNPSFGAISLKGNLDRESRDSITFTVIARDLGEPARSAIATVRVDVLDTNDNNPVFSMITYRTSVKENMRPGVSLVTVNATEKDIAVITYSITAGNNDGLFEIDTASGLISTNTSLNREQTALYILTITAMDDDPVQPRTGLATVVVNILDENDNPPVFVFSCYLVTLLEDAPVGTALAIDSLFATDKDINENAQLSYSLEADGNIGSAFTLNGTTIVLSTTTELDRETLSSYKLNVTVTDGGTPRMSGNAMIVVTVEDVNDHAPVFSQPSYTSKFAENVFGGHTVATVSATDGDIGMNADITFHIVDGSEGKLIIAPLSGVVTTIAEFDYESVSSYNLTVMASDGGTYPRSRNSTVSLYITILDVNDNTPIFSSSSYSFSLSESTSVGASVFNVSASDRDSGDNSLLRFNLTDGDPYDQFDIDVRTGRIDLIRPLDYEHTTSYRLTIEASDGGVPSRTAVTRVDATVTDSNDNPPVFASSDYAAVVSEASNNMSVVTVVSATDRDEGSNADIRFSITDGNVNGHFGINSRSGEVSTAARLDRETQDYYLLTVTVTDSATLPHSVHTTININISDYNDNSPIFNPLDSFITIPEDFEVDSFLIKVNASDVDIGDNARVSYTITSGDDGRFAIDGVTGEVKTTSTFDRETKSSYQLFVQAQDHGATQQNTGYGTLTVTISDVNDNSPYFEQSTYSGVVEENQPVGTSILAVVARDRDVGSNQYVSYSVVTDGVPFYVDNTTGWIYTSKELNREARRNYTFIVVATNSRSEILLNDTTRVFVSVLDVNDNTPTFSASVYRVSVSELLPQGTTVVTVAASDIDIGESGELFFSISSGDQQSPFNFADEKKGDIVIVRSLDRETVPLYELTVVVRDNGAIKRTSTAKVQITLLDENDNAPVFVKSTYTFSLMESVILDWQIGVVSATDKDEGTNKVIEYEIVDGNQQRRFSIVPDSGIIVLDASLDYESVESYTLTVRASNKKAGVPRVTIPIPVVQSRRRRALNQNETSNATVSSTVPPTQSLPPTAAAVDDSWALNSSATVVITVLDVNDNAPIFDELNYVAGVRVDASLDHLVKTVTARDRDSGNFSMVRYLLQDSSSVSEAFRIDPLSGDIYTASASQFFEDAGSHFDLSVIAYDNFGRDKSLSGSTTVTIYILTESNEILMVLGVNEELVKTKEALLTKILENVTNFDINIDLIQAHKVPTGYDLTSTDVFFHAIDPTTKRVAEREVVIKIIEDNLDLIYLLLGDFNVTTVGQPPVVEEVIASENDSILYILIGVVGCVTFILILLLVCICWRRRRRRKYKKKMQTTLVGDGVMFGSPPSTLQLEPYDMNDDDGGNHRDTITRENPIWVDPYDTWLEKSVDGSGVALIDEDEDEEDEGDYEKDEVLDRENPLYESQEIKMDMFVDTSDVETDDFEGGDGSHDNLLAAALDEPTNVTTTAI